jgi:hypothetical protein
VLVNGKDIFLDSQSLGSTADDTADDTGVVCPNHHEETARSNSPKPDKEDLQKTKLPSSASGSEYLQSQISEVGKVCRTGRPMNGQHL